MYTVIAQTRNINIEPSSQLLNTTSTKKRSYQYNKFDTLSLINTSTIYTEVNIISSLHYSCLLNEFSDIINDSGPTCRNTSGRSYHLTFGWPICGAVRTIWGIFLSEI